MLVRNVLFITLAIIYQKEAKTVNISNDWKIYKTSDWTIEYPNDYQILENQTVSTDGVKTKSLGTITILPIKNGDFVITIEPSLFGYGVNSLDDAVDKNGWCSEITLKKAQEYILSDRKAFLFKDVPCGPYGVTAVYTTDNKMIYLFKVESQKPMRWNFSISNRKIVSIQYKKPLDLMAKLPKKC